VLPLNLSLSLREERIKSFGILKMSIIAEEHKQCIKEELTRNLQESVRLIAVENDLIRADIIKATEFSHLAQKYSVMCVPKVVINEHIEFVGVLSEENFIQQILLVQRPSNMDI
jgi:hypothetical protein